MRSCHMPALSPTLNCPCKLWRPSLAEQAQAGMVRQSGGVLDAVIQGYVSDGLITREEASTMSPEQLEFLIRKRTRSNSPAPPAARRAPSPPQPAAPAQVQTRPSALRAGSPRACRRHPPCPSSSVHPALVRAQSGSLPRKGVLRQQPFASPLLKASSLDPLRNCRR